VAPGGAASAAGTGAPPGAWRCGRFLLDLDRVRVMGVLNVTPDSFSDGGRYAALDAALARAGVLIEEGADILDIGGESTRPGAAPVPVEVQMERVLPLLRQLRDAPLPISIDTSEPALMRAALDEGAAIINDVRALRRDGAIEAVRTGQCGVVLMHMQGEPATMQDAPAYAEVVGEVHDWLAARCAAVVEAGVAAPRIALDPGFGFGKTLEHNRRLLAGLSRLADLGQPVLVGLSRKSSLGRLTGRTVGDRLAASLAAALLAAQRGARIVRVHDVAPTRDALAVWEAVRDGDGAPGGAQERP
jgi:dihydropteroate synthase